MVELEGYREFVSEPSLSVSSPYHKGIIENTTIHAHGSVNLSIYNGRCANNHTFILELFDGRSGFADTPVQQHVELVFLLPAYSYQPRHIDCLEECDHRVRGLHP